MPPHLTHFLCIPLTSPTATPQLQTSLAAFRSDIAKSRTPENPDGIPETAIRPVGTLHLTLGVMSLLTPERVEGALRVLKSLDLAEMLKAGAGDGGEKGGQSVGLSITLRGLHGMQEREKTSVLYSSPVDDDRRLQCFCQRLKDAFTAADLLVNDTRPLLLHATVLNTIYVPGPKGRGGGYGKQRAKLTFDAREILGDYEDFEWMKDVRVEKVAICSMGARKLEGGEEEYFVEGEVEMPR